MTPDSHELFTAVLEQLPDGLIIVNIRPTGLILVTGAAGSGKSTTLADCRYGMEVED